MTSAGEVPTYQCFVSQDLTTINTLICFDFMDGLKRDKTPAGG